MQKTFTYKKINPRFNNNYTNSDGIAYDHSF